MIFSPRNFFLKKWQPELAEIDKSVSIDQNYQIFTYMLEYLCTDTVANDVINNESLYHNLMVQAKYFRFQTLIKMLQKLKKQITIEINSL